MSGPEEFGNGESGGEGGMERKRNFRRQTLDIRDDEWDGELYEGPCPLGVVPWAYPPASTYLPFYGSESGEPGGRVLERGKIYRVECVSWVERGLRSGLWALGQGVVRLPALLLLSSLVAGALCLLPLFIHQDSFARPRSPFASFSPASRDLVSVNQDPTFRASDAPLFNASSPRFSPLRRYAQGDFALLLHTLSSAKTATVLKEDVLDAYLALSHSIRELQVEDGSMRYNYSRLCRQRRRGQCDTDSVDAMIRQGLGAELTFPDTFVSGLPNAASEDNITKVHLSTTLGGVETDPQGAVARARALALHFRLRPTVEPHIVAAWDSGFRALAANLSSEVPAKVGFGAWSHGAFLESVEEGLGRVWRHMGFSLLILVGGCALGLMRVSPYGSRPLLGAVVALVVALAALCGVSLRLAATQALNPAVFPALFIVAAIGLLLYSSLIQSWTNFSNVAIHPREKLQFLLSWDGPLLGTTLCVGVVTFAVVGAATDLPFYKDLCLSLAAGLALLLVLGLGLFAPALYLDGRREAAGLRWFHFWRQGDTHFPLPLTKDFDEKNLLRLHAKLIDAQPTPARAVGAGLGKVQTRYLALLGLALYAIFGIWGCSVARVELAEEAFLPEHSAPAAFLRSFRRYFGRTERHLELVFEGPVDYMDPDTRLAILDMLDWTVETKQATKVVSWLKDFLRFEQSSIYLVNRDTFVPVVNLIFLTTQPYSDYKQDIALDAYQSQIVGSRMYVELTGAGERDHRDLIAALLGKAQEAQLPLRIEAPSVFLLQHNMGLPNVLVLAFLLPVVVLGLLTLVGTAQPLTAMLVAGASSSVAIGTIGYGALWGVPVNAATAGLVLAGLAHSAAAVATVAHHFAGAGVRKLATARLEYALQATLWPVLLSTLVPILAFLPLLGLETPVLTELGKVLLLHLGFTALHALLFVPGTLALVTLQMPHCCLALKELCDEAGGCGCCDSEEDATSIYYIPTSGRSVDPDLINRFFGNRALSYVEDKGSLREGHYALPPPPRREMIMPPPVREQRPDLVYPDRDRDATAGRPRIHSRASSIASRRRESRPRTPLQDARGTAGSRRRHESRSPERGLGSELGSGRRGRGSLVRDEGRRSAAEELRDEPPRGDSPASVAESGSVYVVQDGTGGRQDLRHVPRHFARAMAGGGEQRGRAYASARWSREGGGEGPGPGPGAGPGPYPYAMDDMRWGMGPGMVPRRGYPGDVGGMGAAYPPPPPPGYAPQDFRGGPRPVRASMRHLPRPHPHHPAPHHIPPW